ncbi:MAG: protein translocase subunit SecD [Bacteroidota bacterium]
MRNKGFFWFLVIVLSVVCVYQLSFTFVSSKVEAKAEKEATERVAELKLKAKENGNIGLLPNGTTVDFSSPEGDELAHAAFVNQILKEKADTKVYPVLGSTFSDVKKKSLAFGLDLVGGMSVTMEISIPLLIESYARNPRSLEFKKPYDAAYKEYTTKGGDFIALFQKYNTQYNGNRPLVRLFSTTDMEGLGYKSTDGEITSYFKRIVGSSMDGVEQIMNRRINQFGVAQPNILKDPANNRLYIELPGVQDEATVAAKLQSTANLQFYETYFPQEIGNQWQQASMISRQTQVEDAPIESDTLGLAKADSLDSNKTVKPITSLTAGKSQKGLADYVKGTGGYSIGYVSAEDQAAVNEILNRSDVIAVFPEDLKFMWSADLEEINPKTKEKGYSLYGIKVPETGKAKVGGKDIKSASTGYDQTGGLVTVDLEMSADGGDKWSQMTSENVDRIVAITMDNVVYSAPRVINPITGGRTQISGSFTIDEAKSLAGLLNGGSLPAPCVIKEKTKVGPTIGAENSKAGLMAFGIAFAVIFAYMIFYYAKAGIVANIALIANILFIFGTLASFGAVLTLAGIAGIVLTIGMAVDSNVIVYERIREELAHGKDTKTAIADGYKYSLSTILDANITSLLTAIIMKEFGSGPVESYATTLIIGIFSTLFGTLVIGRLIFEYMLSKGKEISFETRFSKGFLKSTTFDFVGKRKIFYTISIVLAIVSFTALFTNKLRPSVEFSGGRTFGVKFDKPAGAHLNELRAALSSEFVENGLPASIDTKTKGNNYFVEITTNYKLSDESATNEVTEKLATALAKTENSLGKYKIMESRAITASFSEEMVSNSVMVLILSLAVMFIYILIRFKTWQFSLGALVALGHDVLFVLGAFALLHTVMPFNMDIDQHFIAAVLTVIGYSMNDTVVVFDRIREYLRENPDSDKKKVVNDALNSTLSRTFNISLAVLLVLVVMFLLGGTAIKGFVFALIIGVIAGTYSSLFVATPLLVDMSKKLRA